MHIF
jgi:small subunit ribosomal protein S1